MYNYTALWKLTRQVLMLWLPSSAAVALELRYTASPAASRHAHQNSAPHPPQQPYHPGGRRTDSPARGSGACIVRGMHGPSASHRTHARTARVAHITPWVGRVPKAASAQELCSYRACQSSLLLLPPLPPPIFCSHIDISSPGSPGSGSSSVIPTIYQQ